MILKKQTHLLSNIKKGVKINLSAWLLILPTLFALYFAIWRPQILGIIWSMFRMKGYNATEYVGLKNYINVISDLDFIPILLNTLKYVVWSLVIGFIPPIIVAVMVNEMIYSKNFFKVLIYIPSILPGIAVSLMWYFMYYPDPTGLLNMVLNRLGIESFSWLNNASAVIPLIVISMTWKGMGGSMLLYFCALQGINTELYEAAEIDGAGMLKKIKYVTLPQISGIILINFVRQIIGVFQIMEEPMAMTGGGPNGASISLGYQLYRYGFVTGKIGNALALGGIMFIILVIATCFYFYLNRKVEENFN